MQGKFGENIIHYIDMKGSRVAIALMKVIQKDEKLHSSGREEK
jgi:hypothetical protein